MFFRNFRHFRDARNRFDELVKGGMDADLAGDQVIEEARAKGIDPTTIMAIISLIMQLIEMFKKK